MPVYHGYFAEVRPVYNVRVHAIKFSLVFAKNNKKKRNTITLKSSKEAE